MGFKGLSVRLYKPSLITETVNAVLGNDADALNVGETI